MSRVGASVDGADVIAGAQPGLRGRGVVTRGQYAQIVLAGQFDAEIAGRQRSARFRLLHFIRRQVCAVRIQ